MQAEIEFRILAPLDYDIEKGLRIDGVRETDLYGVAIGETK
jgi:hypothetical protein